MRLWHYQIIRHLPRSQLLAQWRELNSIIKKHDRHILINYVYEYPDECLIHYANIVAGEMERRGYHIRSFDNYLELMRRTDPKIVASMAGENPFPRHHTDRYFLQCFFNLQEKYERGQADFGKERYLELERVAEVLLILGKEKIWHE